MEHNLMTNLRDVGRLTLFAVPLLTAMVFSSCSQDEDAVGVNPEGTFSRLLFNASVDDGWTDNTSRGMKTTSLEEAFGLFGYNYLGSWNNGNSNNTDRTWLCDAEVTLSNNGWETSELVSMNDTKEHFQFFAYYPYLHSDFSSEEEFKFLEGMPYTLVPELDEITNEPTGETIKQLKDGNPTYNFVTATNAADQVDFLVGVSVERSKAGLLDQDNPIRIKFKHALAGVVFKVGTITEPMTINKIELTNVNKKGTLKVAPPTDADYSTAVFNNWSNVGTIGTVYTEPTFKVIGDGSDRGTTINNGDLVMFLVPQELPSDAMIRMTVNSDIVLTQQINPTGTTPLQQGKITKFTLSVTSMQQLKIETQITNWGEGQSFSGSGSDGNSIVPATIIDDWGEGSSTTWDGNGDATTTPPASGD